MTEATRINNEYKNECYLVPLADIYESDEKYSVIFEMPGVEKENLDIIIDNDSLEIKGGVTPHKTEDKQLKYAEYDFHNFQRRFKIGNEINRNRVEANLKDGILTLDLYKSEEVKPKKISVNVTN